MSVIRDLSAADLDNVRISTGTVCTVRGNTVVAPDGQIFFFVTTDERSYRAALARCRAQAEKVSTHV